MFEQIEDRQRPEIKWWTIPGACFLFFCGGAEAGILIGRRTTDPFQWLQFAFVFLISIAVLRPIGREVSRRIADRRAPNAD